LLLLLLREVGKWAVWEWETWVMEREEVCIRSRGWEVVGERRDGEVCFVDEAEMAEGGGRGDHGRCEFATLRRVKGLMFERVG
jgi:hypothetical protein